MHFTGELIKAHDFKHHVCVKEFHIYIFCPDLFPKLDFIACMPNRHHKININDNSIFLIT